MEFLLINCSLLNHVTPIENSPASYKLCGVTNVHEANYAGHNTSLCIHHGGDICCKCDHKMLPRMLG